MGPEHLRLTPQQALSRLVPRRLSAQIDPSLGESF